MNAEDHRWAAPAQDIIGAYPARYDTEALPHRRMAAYARWATVIAVAEAFALGAMGLALAALVPLQKVVPMVVTGSDKGDQIIRVNPVSLESPTSDYLTEIQIRNYIKARSTIVGSTAEQEILWGQNSPMQLMSSKEVYDKFVSDARPDWTRMRSTNQIRNVEIDSVRKLRDRIWQVEYTTIDRLESTPFQGEVPPTRRRWITTLEVTFTPKAVRYDDRLINPLGMEVVQINDARRD